MNKRINRKDLDLSYMEIEVRTLAESTSPRPGQEKIKYLREALILSDEARCKLSNVIEDMKKKLEDHKKQINELKSEIRNMFSQLNPVDCGMFDYNFSSHLMPDNIVDEYVISQGLTLNELAHVDRNYLKLTVALSMVRDKSASIAEKNGFKVLGFHNREPYAIIDEANTEEEGENLADKYNFPFRMPESMHDVISWRRLDEETIIGIIGDDRLGFGSNDGNWLWVVVRWNPLSLCKIFFDEDRKML